MTAHGHRRQVLLFLVAIILPCVVLVMLGLRIMTQDQELRAKRLADERRAVVGQLRQELTARLDAIACREATALVAGPTRATQRPDERSEVVLIATAAGGGVTLPWERDPRSAGFRRSLAQPAFAELVRRGEHAEIMRRAPGEAVAIYTEALAAARDRAQITFARLLRARASTASRWSSTPRGRVSTGGEVDIHSRRCSA